MGGDVCHLMCYPESLEKALCHKDAGCATVDKSPYTFHLAKSVWDLYFVDYVCGIRYFSAAEVLT